MHSNVDTIPHALREMQINSSQAVNEINALASADPHVWQTDGPDSGEALSGFLGRMQQARVPAGSV